MKKFKKVLAVGVSCLLTAGMLLGCGNKGNQQSAADDGKALPAITEIKLGEDYTDLEASIKFLTHKTDVVDTLFKDYVNQFNEIYPNIKIEYEGITDYSESVTLRLTTDDWGEICMIPTTVDKPDLDSMFVSFGKQDELSQEYIMLNNFSFNNQVYGIPSMGNAQGIIYNKEVFKQAGITEIPRTPEDFLSALQQIRDNTDAIPMYSNFAAGWTMGAWDAYIGGSATGDPNFMAYDLLHTDTPFSKRDDLTGPYAVYYVLYEATARGLIEEDPTTTDWERSKGMMNSGEIGTMVLGSWAVVQMQEAGDNPDNIGYMPFPITVDGKQYASAGPDYNYGINKKTSYENQLASMIYIKWLTEESNFAYDQGGVPVQVGSEYPAVLEAFDGIEMVIDNPAVEGEEDLFNKLNNESEVGLNSDNYPDSLILEHALLGDKTLDDIMDEWNAKWAAAREKLGVED